MLILADETLEWFFETAFPSSFHLSPLTSSEPRTPGLTTFANLRGVSNQTVSAMTTSLSNLSLPTSAVGQGVPPGSKGLRGMLDNIVTDGMRVAAEVKRRMDEAQKELEKSAAEGRPGAGAQQDDEDDEEHEEHEGDLLEGAEAKAVDALAGASAQGDAGQARLARRPSEMGESLI